MKKFLVLFLTIAMLTSLFTACTPTDKPEETPGSSTPSSPSAESTPSDKPDESESEETGMYNSVTAIPDLSP